jgi:hypothetical protein
VAALAGAASIGAAHLAEAIQYRARPAATATALPPEAVTAEALIDALAVALKTLDLPGELRGIAASIDSLGEAIARLEGV